jgi:hypothetical protein
MVLSPNYMIFTIFGGNVFALKQNMDAPNPGLLSEFEGSAAPPPEQVTVSLKLDADLLDWLKQEPLGWQREINNAVVHHGHEQHARAADRGLRGGV